jgi:hypothetical protein
VGTAGTAGSVCRLAVGIVASVGAVGEIGTVREAVAVSVGTPVGEAVGDRIEPTGRALAGLLVCDFFEVVSVFSLAWNTAAVLGWFESLELLPRFFCFFCSHNVANGSCSGTISLFQTHFNVGTF